MSCLLKLRDRLRHVEQSLTSSSQFTDQRSNQEKYKVVEGETPSLVFAMSRISSNLFLMTEVYFPG